MSNRKGENLGRVNGLSNHKTIGDRSARATNRSSRGKERSYRRSHFLVSTSIRRVRVFPRFCPVATMLNSRNIISWVQGNCFIARNNGPVFTVGPLITLLLSIALFGDYTWRRFNNDRSPPRFASLNFLSSRKLCFRVIFFASEKGGSRKKG